MRFFLVIAVSILVSTGLRASKVSVSLYALELGASPAMVGLFAALYALFPLALALHAGRTADARGVFRPIMFGTIVMVIGAALPILGTNLWALAICASLIGLGHIYAHVAVHAFVGASATGNDRTKNFGLLSLGASVAAFIGPASAGFAIDGLGYRSAFLAVGLVAIVAAVLIFSLRGSLSSLLPNKSTDDAPKSTLDLLANPELRRTMLLSGATLTGIELFTFYFPIYGRSINLSASTIGMILAAYAVSAFIVRAFLHHITRRYREVTVLGVSLISAAIVYAAVPHIGSAVLLAAAALLLGLGLGSAQPLTTVLTYNNAPPGRGGEALGLRLTVNKATQISVPLVFGSLGAAAGVAPVFWATAVFLGVAGVLSMTVARAQEFSSREVSSREFPSRTVTMVVPFTPGTGADIIARTLGPRLAERWKVGVVTDNRSGASGNIAAEHVARAVPDGHTTLFTATIFASNRAINTKLPFDPVTHFAPVVLIATSPVGLLVHAQFPAANLSQLVAEAKKQPAKYHYASTGNGGPQHLAMELFKLESGIDLVHIPYKNNGTAVADLVGGHVQAMVIPMHTAAPFVRNGKLRLLAVMSERRASAFPETPTVAEQGIANVALDTWYGVFVPAATPSAIVTRLNTDLNAMLAEPAVRDSLANQGMTVAGGSPERLGVLLKSELARWSRVVNAAGIKAD